MYENRPTVTAIHPVLYTSVSSNRKLFSYKVDDAPPLGDVKTGLIKYLSKVPFFFKYSNTCFKLFWKKILGRSIFNTFSEYLYLKSMILSKTFFVQLLITFYINKINVIYTWNNKTIALSCIPFQISDPENPIYIVCTIVHLIYQPGKLVLDPEIFDRLK